MNDANGRKPTPSKVVNLKDVQRPSEKNAANPIPNDKPAKNSRQNVQPVRPTNVTPTMNNRQKVQPARPTNVTPAMNNKQKVQPSRSVNPPKKVQPQQPRIVNPPKENRMAQPSQPKTNQEEKEKR